MLFFLTLAPCLNKTSVELKVLVHIRFQFDTHSLNKTSVELKEYLKKFAQNEADSLNKTSVELKEARPLFHHLRFCQSQ